MTDLSLSPGERDALAAELALGVLEGEGRAQALRLTLADPAFAALVETWGACLAPLGSDFAEADPPADLWPAIERRLGGGGATSSDLRWWRRAAIGSGAVAASLAVFLFLRPAPAPVAGVRMPDQVAIAQLDGGERGALLAASYDAASSTLRVRALRMPESRLAPELWVIPEDGVPRSLGLVARDGISRIAVGSALRTMIREGATLAVTMEPGEGAPHRAPSSAPVAAGKISMI